MKMQKKSIVSLAALSALVLLPGCDWFGSPQKDSSSMDATSNMSNQNYVNDDSKVVVTIAGKPFITEKELRDTLDKLMEAQPQYKAMLGLMDENQLLASILQGLLMQKLMDEWAVRTGIMDQAEYKQKLEDQILNAKRMVNAEFFTQNVKVNVSDAQVKEFYDKNKDVMPQLLISRGGVNAKGVVFETDADAQAFLNKVKSEFGKDLDKAAAAQKVMDKLKDFNVVNDQSIGIDPALRDKIVAIKSTPSLMVIKAGDKAFWVVSATGKEETKYRPLQQIKEDLRAFLEKEKLMEETTKEMERLKGEYNVVVDQEFFKPAEQPQQQIDADQLQKQVNESVKQETAQNESTQQPVTRAA